MTKRMALACVIAAVTLVGCSAVGGPEGGENSTNENQGKAASPEACNMDKPLDISRVADADTLDPHNSFIATDQTPLFAIFDTLVTSNSDLTLSPGLAESWEWIDPTTLNLQIRTGVKFHDGTDLDAEAVAWNIRRQLADESLRARSGVLGIESVEVPDATHVILKISEPDGTLLSTLSTQNGMVMSPTAAEADPDSVATQPVGTGPFMLEKWTRGSLMNLTANPDYWAEGPYAAGVVMRPIPDASQRLVEMTSGQSNIIEQVDPKDLEALQNNDGVSVFERSSTQFTFLAFNTRIAPWDDPRVRQAVAWAVDRQAIADAIYFGAAQPANGPFPDAFAWLKDQPEDRFPSRDVGKAKELLKEAGFEDGLTVEVNAPNRAPEVPSLEVMQQQLEEVGITMKIKAIDTAESASLYAQGNFEASFHTWSGRTDPHLQVLNSLTSSGGANGAGYTSPEFDAAIEKGRETDDMSKRSVAYGEATRIILEDSPWAFIVSPDVIQAVDSDVIGFEQWPGYHIHGLATTCVAK